MSGNTKKIQGEFFDCTVQGYNDNGHGKHKIDYALQNGISIPIQKYIEELQMIEENTFDDKSEKRAQRLYFLNRVAEVQVLVDYFIYFTTYLNGGTNISGIDEFGSNFEFNKLIITIAGGNIITIFAKLLNDLFLNRQSTEIYFNQIILSNPEMMEQLYYWVVTCPPDFRQLIVEMASKDFSDFDYNILPNKCINEAYSMMRPEMPPEDHSSGFYLFRVKTGFVVDAGAVPAGFRQGQGKRNCRYAGLPRDKLNLFYPQGVQENWLLDPSLDERYDNRHRNKAFCRQAILNMLEIKRLIKLETEKNIYTIINLKKEEIGTSNDVIGAMEYIRGITNSMNQVLGGIEYDIGGHQTYEDTPEQWQYLLNTFSSLDTVLDSNLPLISVNLLYDLTNSDELGPFTDRFMDTRQELEGLDHPDICKFTLVPGPLYDKLRKINRSMRDYLSDEQVYPIDGLSITFNHIIIEPRPHDHSLVPKIFAEEADLEDLTSTFEQMTMDDRVPKIDRALLNVVNTALHQLYSGVGGKTLKKKIKKGKKEVKPKIKTKKQRK